MNNGPQIKPPCSNKGGTNQFSPSINPARNAPDSEAGNPAVACHLDWMTYTIAYQPNETVEEAIARALPAYPEFDKSEAAGNPIKGYNTAAQLGIGTVCWHSEDRKMRLAVQLTGRDWSGIDKANIPPEAVIEYALGLLARFTRLDFAIDYHKPADPNDLLKLWGEKKLKTRARRAGRYESISRESGKPITASTVYVGHSSSLRQVRVYDKAKERGESGVWWRIELIARDEAAVVLALAIAEHGVVNAGRQMVRDYMDCDLEWWVEATQGRAVHLAPILNPQTDTDRWLLDDILPILERQIDHNTAMGDTTLLKAVYKIVNKERKNINAKPEGEKMEWAKNQIKGWGVSNGES